MVEERPLALLGIPSAISLFVGVFFGMWMLQIYSFEHYIVTNIALSAIRLYINRFLWIIYVNNVVLNNKAITKN